MDLVARILEAAPEHLRPGGALVCEIGDNRRGARAALPSLCRFPGRCARCSSIGLQKRPALLEARDHGGRELADQRALALVAAPRSELTAGAPRHRDVVQVAEQILQIGEPAQIAGRRR